MANNKVGLLNDELRSALEHVSGKTIEGDFQTTAEMLHAFNDLYVCKAKFDVVDSSTAAPLVDAVVTVKSGDEIIDPRADGKYYLGAGTYVYDCVCDGYTDISGASFEISDSDVTRGSKSITIQMTAAA